MKLSNFKLIEVIGKNSLDWKAKALVDVTTGLIFKKTIAREIYRKYASNWSFSHNGEYTPGFQAEALERSYEAGNGDIFKR